MKDKGHAIPEDLLHAEPATVAEAADLTYTLDDCPGYTRRRRGKGFSYIDPTGQVVRNAALRRRFETLAIPPAWRDVWICPDPNGHLQATGRDDQERKQYIYHPRWAEVRNRAKFDRMVSFAEALPTIRAQVDEDLAGHSPTFAKVVALVVRLLDDTQIRVGNEEYARHHDSYGLTTLLDEHISLNGKQLIFEFTGKSGQEQRIVVKNRRLARLVQECQELPGQQLFQYRGENGELQPVRSTEVNDYLREITDDNFSAKDFRTWGGTVTAATTLCKLGPCATEKEIQNNLRIATAAAAKRLGNTVAVCRRYYIHPKIFDAYARGRLCDFLEKVAAKHIPAPHGLDANEAAVYALLTKTNQSKENE
jgi:DNA topoisomerase-1